MGLHIADESQFSEIALCVIINPLDNIWKRIIAECEGE